MHVCPLYVLRGLKGAVDPLELESQGIVNNSVVAGNFTQSSVRAAVALNCGNISFSTPPFKSGFNVLFTFMSVSKYVHVCM